MQDQKEFSDYSKVHPEHYSLLANLRASPPISSAPLCTVLRVFIVIYTMFYMALLFTPPQLVVEFAPYRYLLSALYHFFFPLHTILTSIAGVDLLYILHLLLLSVNVEFIDVVHNGFPGNFDFYENYTIVSLVLALVNLVFFFYWSIPNRLLLINVFQVGVKVKTQEPNNILKRMWLLWLPAFLVCSGAACAIPIWMKMVDPMNLTVKFKIYYESLPYLNYVAILIIEYFMYKQTHSLYQYKLKDLIQLRGASNVIYVTIIVLSFLYFCITNIGGMSNLISPWYAKHSQAIELINLITKVVFCVRFYFLWNISIQDIAKELSRFSGKSKYPKWSWDWIQVKE